MVVKIMIKVGQRVKVKSLNIKGTVEYIDKPYLNRDYMYPIQVRLDKPYYKPVQPNSYLYRTGLKDLIIIKREKQVFELVNIKPYKKEIKKFLKWLEQY